MKLFRSNRVRIAIVLLLAALFLFRPGLHKLRTRIATAIGSALGRRVEIQEVRLRILPRPGFELDGLVIYDDPSFSAEPMVSAAEVTAPVRWSSLLRGRLEIANLSASEPSINLVRDPSGRWNLSTLLERSAQIPSAPTAKRPSERRPAFPYLEATHARVNFKIAQEKTPFALSDADLALWQESDNSWGARLTAQPVRTEFNLTDTGLLRVNATWERAQRLSDTPLQATISWQNAQLGQMTKLFSRRDRGWRGAVSFNANLSGTPQSLLIRAQATVEDFRRYDISSANVRLATACTGRYNAANREFDDIFCESPIAGGLARIRGRVGPFMQGFPYDVTLSAEKIPLAKVLGVVRVAKQSLPADLTASGSFDGEFHAQRAAGARPQFSGAGSLSSARLETSDARNAILPGNIPVTLVRAADPGTKPLGHIATMPDAPEAQSYVRFGPFSLVVGGSPATTASGWISRSGYHFTLRGESTVKNAYQLAKTFGVPIRQPAAQGNVRLDLALSGPWHGFTAPEVTGTAELANVRAEMHGFDQPLLINSALLTLTPDAASLKRVSAQTGATHWTGSIASPRNCPAPCTIEFNLSADQLSATDLSDWFTAHPAKRPWYRLLTSEADDKRPSPLLTAKAHGSLRVARFLLPRVTATQVSTELDLDAGKVTLSAMHAQLLQGTQLGLWTIDCSHSPLRYQASGTLDNISLAQLSAAMNDGWATGAADVRFELTTVGMHFSDLLNAADAQLGFNIRNGTFPHIDLPGASKPFPVHKFAGEFLLKRGEWVLRAGKLESRDGIYQVRGTASQNHGLDFTLTRGNELSWNVTGTLAMPRVAPAARTEAKKQVAGDRSQVTGLR